MRRFVWFGTTAMFLAACAADVGEGRVRAEISEAGEQAEEQTQATRTLAVDVAQSKLGLIGAKVTAHHPIHFNEFTGEVGLDGDAVTSIHFVAQIASVESDAARLTTHLKQEDFLYAERYPTGEFRSVSVQPGAEAEGATHTVTGDLTIRGQTQRVTFPATLAVTDAGVTASTEFVIDRRDFGVVYPGRADDLVQDNVVMQIQFVAPASPPATAEGAEPAEPADDASE